MARLALFALVLPLGGCGLVSRTELGGYWLMVEQRMTTADGTVHRVEEAGFIHFDNAYAWGWHWDPNTNSFYALLDPPVITPGPAGVDVDDTENPYLELLYAGGTLYFTPTMELEKNDYDHATLTSEITWGTELLTLEVDIATL